MGSDARHATYTVGHSRHGRDSPLTMAALCETTVTRSALDRRRGL